MSVAYEMCCVGAGREGYWDTEEESELYGLQYNVVEVIFIYKNIMSGQVAECREQCLSNRSTSAFNFEMDLTSHQEQVKYASASMVCGQWTVH